MLARGAVEGQRLLNGIEQIVVAEGLGQKLHRAAFMAGTVIGMSPWPVRLRGELSHYLSITFGYAALFRHDR